MPRPHTRAPLQAPLSVCVALLLGMCSYDTPPHAPLSATPLSSPPPLAPPRPLSGDLRRLTPSSHLAHRCEARLELPLEVGVQTLFDPSVEGQWRRDSAGVTLSMRARGRGGLRGAGASLTLTAPSGLSVDMPYFARISSARCYDARGLLLRDALTLS